MEVQLANQQMAQAIKQVVKKAFLTSEHGYQGEAELVEDLRDSTTPTFERVVIWNQHLVGHMLLSEANVAESKGLVLAPLSVLPAFQRHGVGKALMASAEEIAKDYDYAFISILGDSQYYGRFGYQPAKNFEIKAPMDVPDEAFLIKRFTQTVQQPGILEYAPAFGI
ncbi:putative N-acetyltransferase YhbS [Weissella uvarum]|uniref:GNAT family N-acetyltransferase n=1 Tax=Weissella uvarum TaxID=1479233 RepID=UPI0019612D59|nr:N-acetyltransferase [Weissella uvarum]MBM7618080.1 putative N-acetyltransferase YhbS [Weissella uvarum]MCM0595932.1 N-acetyltransferase [Weissella uvarum]